MTATSQTSREWVDEAVRLVEADTRRSADTHLLRYPLPAAWCDEADVALYLKDESTHITGSLKHRLARSLFLYGLCNGWITENTAVVEASSGSTAVSEAYFAALLGLPFIAVMPASTSRTKVYFSTGCAMAGSPRTPPSSRRLQDQQLCPRRTLPRYSDYRSLR